MCSKICEDLVDDLRDIIFLWRMKYAEAEDRVTRLKAENTILKRQLDEAVDEIDDSQKIMKEQLEESIIQQEDLIDSISVLHETRSYCVEKVKRLTEENQSIMDSFHSLQKEFYFQKEDLDAAIDRIDYQEREKIWMEVENELLQEKLDLSITNLEQTRLGSIYEEEERKYSSLPMENDSGFLSENDQKLDFLRNVTFRRKAKSRRSVL
ncbi:hypothetical protein QR680_007505 [Steinernema hermaphroditum]|uniref:Uncharacterized protein n=1 Tax=Steinernema hermaphroditum TaxID=289476 RepID=A0AA39IFJ4_9BILA|nr:hypothetical protein QR680_007505 [Steinernema hermaphroditum]